MLLKNAIPISLLCITVALLTACKKPQPAPEPVRSVKVLTVSSDGLQGNAQYAGEVRARVESRLGFRVGGKVIRRAVDVGQRVKAGQVLAQLDPQDFKLSVDAARAQVSVAASNRDLAAEDLKRFKALRDQNFISNAELERREATWKSAVSQYDQAQAVLAGQGNQAGYTTLVADVSGIVTAVDAELGQVVAAGVPVVRIAQDGPRDVVFSVPEDKLAAMQVGSKADILAWGRTEQLTGNVREVAASADAVTRTYVVKASLPGKEALPLGATVTVVPQALDRNGTTAIKLPTSALRREGDKAAVWVLDTGNMTVNLQSVQIATADGNDAVISAGLQEGMQVVTSGVHVLSPGQKVTIYKAKNEAVAGK